MHTPRTIRLRGELYRLAEPKGTDALMLKTSLLKLLDRVFGVGHESPTFLPLGGKAGEAKALEDLINVANNFVVLSGEGETPKEASAGVMRALVAARRYVTDFLIPDLDKVRSLLDQLNVAIPNIEGEAFGPVVMPAGPASIGASAVEDQVLAPRRIRVRGATYRRLWDDNVRTAIIQRAIEQALQEGSEEALKQLDVEQLKDMYSYFIQKSIQKSMRAIKTALTTLYTRISGVRKPTDLVKDAPLKIAEDTLLTLVEQLDAATSVLKHIVAIEDKIREEWSAIKARDDAKTHEQALREFAEEKEQAKGRGRPRREVVPPPPGEEVPEPAQAPRKPTSLDSLRSFIQSL